MGASERSAQEMRLAWQVTVVMFAAGALTVVLTLPAPDPDTADHPVFLLMSGVFALLGIGFGLAGPRPRTALVSGFAGVACISVLVAASRPLAAVPFFYLWPMLQLAYFASRRQLVAAQVFMAASYGAALVLFSPPGVRLTYWLSGMAVAALATAVVSHQRRQLDGLVEELRTSAGTDPLTGLTNRREFALAFGRELARAERDGGPLSLGIFDIDHFKSINDRFGHLRGDRVLCEVSKLLSAGMRDGDVVARIGGEEFAVLFAGTDLAEAHRIAGRIAQIVAAHTALSDSPLTVSAGLAERYPGVDTQDRMLSAADAALYEAKAAGRGRVASHKGAMTVTVA